MPLLQNKAVPETYSEQKEGKILKIETAPMKRAAGDQGQKDFSNFSMSN